MAMNRVHLLIVMGLVALVAAPLGAKTEQELRESFKNRRPVLNQFKDAQKIGEVHTGFVDVTDAKYLNDRLDPDDAQSPTVGHIIAAENADRRELYQLIAKRNGVDADTVAQQNADREFERAKPDHYLKPAKSGWVQKKNLQDD